MRQGDGRSLQTSFLYTITCMIMLIIINRIQFPYYSSLERVLSFISNEPIGIYCVSLLRG